MPLTKSKGEDAPQDMFDDVEEEESVRRLAEKIERLLSGDADE